MQFVRANFCLYAKIVETTIRHFAAPGTTTIRHYADRDVTTIRHHTFLA